jgi:hypothetical protein
VIPDLINGGWEAIGAATICFSIAKVLRDRCVRGISWVHVSFFTGWSLWDLYLYTYLAMPLSFAGGIAIALATCTYVTLLLYFGGRAT